MNRFVKTGTLAGFIMLAISCKIQKNSADSSNEKDGMRVATIKAIIQDSVKNSDPITIEGVSFTDNLMILDVNYLAGCQAHEFEFIGKSKIEKSMPPIRSVQLIHHSNQDTCKVVFKRRMFIDVSELAYKKETGSEIFLKLDGWKEKIKYTFQ